MSIKGVVTDGLKTCFDGSNRKSNILAKPSLIDPVWQIGSDGYGIYGANGSVGENARVMGTDPWGQPAVVWETRANGNGNDDGGWNTSRFTIDRTKLYRFSVWVKRTSSTSGGTFYFGTGSNGGVFSVADGLEKGNPYWDCRNVGFTLDQWYLVVGHIFPSSTTTTTNHPTSGWYTVQTGTTINMGLNYCNIASDLKWGPTSTDAVHRTYHYYCGDATTRLHFFSPRVDLCDGTELSIAELLKVSMSSWTDISGNGYKAYPQATSTTTPSITSNGMTFDGTNHMEFGIAVASTNSTSQSWEAWVRPATSMATSGIFGHVVSGGCTYYCNGGICIASGNYMFNWYDNANYQFLDSGVAATSGTFAHIVAVWDGPSSSPKIYVNGVLKASGGASNLNYGGGTNLGYVGRFSASANLFNGSIQNIKHYYAKALTATEVRQNFEALRGRFGI